MKLSRPRSLLKAARAMGPYLALELLVPGGTLFSLLLWRARNRRAARAAAAAQGEADALEPRAAV